MCTLSRNIYRSIVRHCNDDVYSLQLHKTFRSSVRGEEGARSRKNPMQTISLIYEILYKYVQYNEGVTRTLI